MPQPQSLANLRPPWQKGVHQHGRSVDVEKTLQRARKGSGKALTRVFEIMDDPTESTRYRLDAAKVILQLAMPKDPATLERMLAEMTNGGERVFRIEFVDPVRDAPVVIDNALAPRPNGHANGHEAQPVFIDPDPEE